MNKNMTDNSLPAMKNRKDISILALSMLIIFALTALYIMPSQAVEALDVGKSVWFGGVDTSLYDDYDAETEFIITSADQLAGLAHLVSDDGKTFSGKTIRLAVDIDLSGDIDQQWGAIGYYKFSERVDSSRPFSGVFDGQGHSIEGLFISADRSCQGLFGHVRDGIVKNIAVSGDVTAPNFVGLIAGRNDTGNGSSTIFNCTVTGRVTATGSNAYAGGIIGYNCATNNLGATNKRATVTNCVSLCSVSTNTSTGRTYAGGIAGGNSGSGTLTTAMMSYCTSMGNSSIAAVGGRFAYAGGIVGQNSNSTVTNSSVTVDNVSATGTSTVYVGGVVGNDSSSAVTNCGWLNTSTTKGIGNGNGTDVVSFDSEHAANIVTSYTIDPSSCVVSADESTIIFRTWPRTSADAVKNWSATVSPDNGGLIVEQNGGNTKVTGKKAGNYIVMASLDFTATQFGTGDVTPLSLSGDMELMATVKVIGSSAPPLSPALVPVTSVAVSPTALSVQVGATSNLTATVSPDNATSNDVTWSSSDENIATVDASGNVTGVAAGSASITATTVGRMANGNPATATCAVTVVAPLIPPAPIPVTGVEIQPTTLSLQVGTTGNLTATVSPENATSKDVTWSSSDENIASVDASGKVTGVNAGTAIITVTTDNGGFAASCDITVTAIPIDNGPQPVRPIIDGGNGCTAGFEALSLLAFALMVLWKK